MSTKYNEAFLGDQQRRQGKKTWTFRRLLQHQSPVVWQNLNSSPPRPERLWSPPSLLSTGYGGALTLEVKRPEREADHSPPSSAEVKEWVELYLHSPNTPSWRGALLKHRDNFLHLSTQYPPS
jgi:hypothetical protein